MPTVLLKNDHHFPMQPSSIEQAIATSLAQSNITDPVEISITLINKDEMAALCEQYMDDGLEHDVLSFPMEESPMPFVSPDGVRRLGDIVVCYPEVVSQAQEKGITNAESLNFLITHAVAHLLGQHHDDRL